MPSQKKRKSNQPAPLVGIQKHRDYIIPDQSNEISKTKALMKEKRAQVVAFERKKDSTQLERWLKYRLVDEYDALNHRLSVLESIQQQRVVQEHF
jgi:hypothetical protein